MQIVIANARYHVTCTPYAKLGYIFEFPTSTLPIHYDTFIGLRWRIRGVYCLLLWPSMLIIIIIIIIIIRQLVRRRKMSIKSLQGRNRAKFFCPDQNWQILALLGVWGSGVSKRCDLYPQKARPFVKPRCLSHFASKSVEGCDLQVGWGKKVRKSQRLP